MFSVLLGVVVAVGCADGGGAGGNRREPPLAGRSPGPGPRNLFAVSPKHPRFDATTSHALVGDAYPNGRAGAGPPT